jgi:hypothetical protein
MEALLPRAVYVETATIMDKFDEQMILLMEAKGITIGREGTYVRLPGYTGPVLVTDEQLRYMNERRRNHEVNGLLKHQWVEGLAEVAQVLDEQGAKAPWPYRSMFWIRLHGVISDLRAECLVHLSKRADRSGNLQAEPRQRALLRL